MPEVEDDVADGSMPRFPGPAAVTAEHIAFPFTLRRRNDVVGMELITSTRETTHGLLRFGEDGLRVQWRLSRATKHVGDAIRTDREIDPVQEAHVPASALAGAAVRWLWNRWPPGRYLVITAADFRAFEGVAGLAGLPTAASSRGCEEPLLGGMGRRSSSAPGGSRGCLRVGRTRS
jgi:hypothetical protein